MLGKVEAPGSNRFSDYLTPEGRKKVKFNNSLDRFRQVLSQFAEKPIGLKENPTTLFEERADKKDGGALIRSVIVYRDLDITLLARENELTRVQPKNANSYWKVEIQAREVRLSRGDIQWINAGSDFAHNNVNNNRDVNYVDSQYFKEKEMVTRMPELRPAMEINAKTEALNFFIRLLPPLPAKEKPVKKTKEEVIYDKAFKKFIEAFPYFNVAELKVIESQPLTLVDEINDVVDGFSRTAIVVRKTENGPVILEANQVLISHHVPENRSFWGKTTNTYYVTLDLNNLRAESIKKGHHFTYLSQGEIGTVLNPNQPIEPAADISKPEDVAKKTEALKEVTNLLVTTSHSRKDRPSVMSA